MVSGNPIQVEQVSHFFGKGNLKKQILFDVSTEIAAGEIVIITGPSGSGKTTLLTLIGALRSCQEGKVSVLDNDLSRASRRDLVKVRRKIGYIFQQHNLLDSLTVAQNERTTGTVRSALANPPGPIVSSPGRSCRCG